MSLNGFAPQTATFKATLVGGKAVKITLRPFTLADVAWFQKEFSEEKDLMAFSDMNPDAVCKALWQMMESKSKKLFSNIKFTDFDEDSGKDVPVEIRGYEKLLHSFEGEQSIHNGMLAIGESRGLNSFLEDIKKKMKKAA